MNLRNFNLCYDSKFSIFNDYVPIQSSVFIQFDYSSVFKMKYDIDSSVINISSQCFFELFRLIHSFLRELPRENLRYKRSFSEEFFEKDLILGRFYFA
ncbi:hypothetical protein LIC_11705 [Leptospira interrogans serovar Copenhageni str. Fiocruz L1-130]|uniref:Uncharacterized protein n=1 Tax=Leptospira interrogans serogroup Icterohaemorrhagiae serovar copenhageni (strain Fiocruz L1-130) TaxID=267671 RepID=Q72RP0_LEPIC|nr:hypothetical protein LIC_11705 [Leptospira interrogans serovar Copenhageni str. Fiocruz L1-130]